jgi:acyl-CoA synthetase (NDP forming)
VIPAIPTGLDRMTTRDGTEQPAPTLNLKRFFAPSSVAVVGATEDLRKFGGRVLRRIIDFGYPGNIYPVNPTRETIFNLPAHKSVSSLPEVPDHVSIAVPIRFVMPVLEECAALGVPFATVQTSGFAETGDEEGIRLQAEIGALARRSGMRIMGPNCNGVISFINNFAMASTGALTGETFTPGNVGIVAQSGGLGQVNIMYRALIQGIGISHEVSCGNQADLDVLDFIDFMVADPDTDVVLVAVEGITDGAKLRRVARKAMDAHKPIVILKFGRSEAGQAAVASHTGALTGSDEVHSAAFRQYGLIRVDDCSQMIEQAMLLRSKRLPKGNRAAAIAASGGHAVNLADLGGSMGIDWPAYTPETQNRLNEILPDFGQAANPTDLTTAATGTTGMFADAIAAVADDTNVDITIPLFTINKRDDILAGADLMSRTDEPVALLWTGKCADDPDFTERHVAETGVPVFRDSLSCLRAARAAMDYNVFLNHTESGLSRPERPADISTAEVTKILASANSTLLNEIDSRAVLAAYGFPTLETLCAENADAAARLAASFGYPVAMKINSADIPHKTEADGVRLGIAGAAAAKQAFAEILAAARSFKPNADVRGVLVQRMAAPGTELVLGASIDPTFGPVVTVGLGGIHVEILHDVAHRIAPVGRDEAQRMLRELKGYAILEGVRGAAARDVSAVCDLIHRLSWLIYDFRDDIRELDINPLMVHETGTDVVDALIVRQSHD